MSGATIATINGIGGSMSLGRFKSILTIVVLSSAVVAYQNCSGTNFQQANADGASLKIDSASTASDTSTGIDPVVVDEQEDGTDPSTGKKCDHKHEHMASADLVECEIMGANAKVILGKSKMLEIGSNASATRVCMTENACLKMVNSYAAGHDGTLALGAAKSTSQSQVAKIFPGSQGTCKNALPLTDATVSKLLVAMSKSK